MRYSINPQEHQLKKARQKVENAIESYSFNIDVEEVVINLGWEKMEKDSSVIHEGDSRLTLIINPKREMEDLEKNVLRGLLEIEFLQKAPFEQYNFNWQEVLKLGYVINKLDHLMDAETGRDLELKEEWSEFRETLTEETGEVDEKFYINASRLGEAIGRKLLEENQLDELPELKKSDVIEAGDQLFSG